MKDTFDADVLSLIFEVVIPALMVLLILVLLRLFFLRLKSTQSVDRCREREPYSKNQRREAKHSAKLPAKSEVLYAKSEQSLWARLSNTLRTLTSFKLSKDSGKNKSETEPTVSREDRGLEAGQQTSVITSEAGDSGGTRWELIEIRRSIATLARENDSNQEILLGELRDIRVLLERSARQGATHHSSERSAGQKATHQRSSQRSHYPESSSSPQIDSAWESLCRLYNAGVRDQNRQQEFKDSYTLVRIGAINYMECARDPSLSLEFGEDSNGYFEAIKAKDGRYVAVPRFNLVIQETQYGPGAVGKVFNCHNYIPGKTYRHIELIQPAVFITDGENWEVDVPGELRLS